MSTPNQPQDPYSSPEGQGQGDQSGSVPPYPGSTPAGGDGSGQAPGGVPQYGQYTGGDATGQPGYGQQPYPGGAQGGYGQPYPGGAQGYGGVYPKNNLAVWSLVLAIVGFFVCSILTSIPGIVLGAKAKQAVARGEANNGSLANAGYITSWIVTVLQVLAIILLIILAATGALATTFDVDSYSTY